MYAVWMVGLLGCGDEDRDSRAGTDDSAVVDLDADNDGFDVGVDCNDQNSAVYPDAPEICDGLDNDCDDATLEWEDDTDGDGWPDCTLCAQAGLWPDILSVEGEESLHAFFAENLTRYPCTRYQTERSYLFRFLDNVNEQVECVYTAQGFPVADEDPDWEVVNTEHTWPRSDGAEVEPVECDLHHLFPAETVANARRASNPFGEVVGTVDWSEGGSRLGADASGALVFEPRPEKRGDIARAILYVAARYPDRINRDAQLNDERMAMFLDWHLADPPDDADAERSRLIAGRQGHNNPFVVCPRITERLQ